MDSIGHRYVVDNILSKVKHSVTYGTTRDLPEYDSE